MLSTVKSWKDQLYKKKNRDHGNELQTIQRGVNSFTSSAFVFCCCCFLLSKNRFHPKDTHIHTRREEHILINTNTPLTIIILLVHDLCTIEENFNSFFFLLFHLVWKFKWQKYAFCRYQPKQYTDVVNKNKNLPFGLK